MLEDTDLEAAATEGIITPAQIDALRAFANRRRNSSERADDERFRFMRGFNDFFLAVGIVLFGLGVIYFAGIDPIKNLIAALIIWALAEILVRRMRLVLPGILLVSLFAFFVYRMTQINWGTVARLTHLPYHPTPRIMTDINYVFGLTEPLAIAGKALAAGIGASIFYARFRLPFALLVIAGSIVLVITMVLGGILFPAAVTRSLILLGCGLGVFAAAMAYDLADRTRSTRFADCAFWLHLLAAPLIVHSLIQLIVPNAISGDVNMSTMSAVTIFIIVALLAAVAILIDRRALLVSALSYLGIAIGYTLTRTVHDSANGKPAIVFTTLLILGVMVLALGVGWHPLRRLFLRLFPSGVVGRLPPAAYPA